ncbi:MAG: MinD/ParA family protein [Deltaproteobacteria bacterium]|nr:MinD/ParA family protein [Deltaproteobacteria bacterium]
MNDQAHTLRRMFSQGNPAPLPQILSVTSGKGGVGKTSIVVNLAVILASMGKKVLVLDADLGLANIDVMLGLTPKYNIKHVLDGQCRLEEILLEGPHGMKIIPATSGIQELVDLSYEQQLSLVNTLDYFDEDMDYLFVDTGAGISRNVMYFNAAAQRIIVVVTPEPTSITDAYALIKVLRNQYGIKRFNLIINNVLSKMEGDEVAKKLTLVCGRFLGDVALDMLGSIPHDSNFSECIKGQKAFVGEYPNGAVAKGLIRITKQIDRLSHGHGTGNLQFFLKRILLNETKGSRHAEYSIPSSY